MSSWDITLSLRLRTRKKLLVSSRSLELDPALDVAFVRFGYGEAAKPYLPASTLKGVLRTALVRVAELLGYTLSVKTVEPSRLATATAFTSGDIVCSLFGRPHGPGGKVYILPTMLDEKTYRLAHVKIDDITRTAEHGGLYTAEYIPIGSEFEAKMEAKGVSVEEAEALLTAIAALPYERVGRAGLVDVKIDVAKSVIPSELTERSRVIKEIMEAVGI
ncbi:MAG: RAMP superfamily CRISPR-associated protein [Nitrososphaerota archaeon]